MTTLAIKKGSNLSTVVRSYNKAHHTHLTVAQVAKQNHLKDANKVHVGQKIHIADRFEAKRPAPKTTKPTTQTQSEPCTNNSPSSETTNRQIVQDVFKKRQAEMDKLFPKKEPFKLTPFKLDPNVQPRPAQPLTKTPSFKLEPFKLKF